MDIMITLATSFTLLRLLLVPGIVWAILAERWALAGGTFVIAAATDMLDGALARWYMAHTTLGACLDAIADKVLLIACFAALAWVHSPMIPSWFVWLLVIKEFLLVLGAGIVGLDKGWGTIQPTLLGKMVTCAQIAFISWLFACRFFGWHPAKTYVVLLSIVTILVVITLFDYALVGLRFIRDIT
jgi:cardiolipin synthase